MKRDYYFDNLKALLIICVVLGHLLPICNSVAASTITIYIYYFHMPLFIFISGFFSKNMEKNRHSAIKIFSIYLIVQITYSILIGIVNHSMDLLLNIFEPINTLWYLLALFIWRYFLEDIVKVKHIIFISSLLFIFVMFVDGIGSYLALQRTLGFSIFFILGYYTDYNIIDKLRNYRKIVPSIILLVLFVLTLIMIKFNILDFQFLISALQHKKMIYEFDSIFIGIMTYILIFVISIVSAISILCICPKDKYFISVLGERTLPIYVCHALIPQLLSIFISMMGIAHKTGIVFIVSLFSTLLVLVTFGNKYFNKLFNVILEKILSYIYIKER